jgi:hypothetical protein
MTPEDDGLTSFRAYWWPRLQQAAATGTQRQQDRIRARYFAACNERDAAERQAREAAEAAERRAVDAKRKRDERARASG